MNKRYVTIVTDGKGSSSYHSSWKSACEAYDWEKSSRVPKEHKGYTIIKAPLDVTIDCLDLVEFLGRKDVKQYHSEHEGQCLTEVTGYDTEYRIYSEFTTRYEDAEYHHGDRGMEEMSPAYEYDEITEVNSVEILTEDGEKEIHIDDWTKSSVLAYLDLNEKL